MSDFEKTKLLIKLFIKDEIVKDKSDKTFWPREIKVARKLLQKNSEVSFWESVKLDFKLNSLAWFLGKEGKECLKETERVNSINLDAINAENMKKLELDKIIVDFTPPLEVFARQEKKSLVDWLK